MLWGKGSSVVAFLSRWRSCRRPQGWKIIRRYVHRTAASRTIIRQFERKEAIACKTCNKTGQENMGQVLERAKGIEPSTLSLGS